MSMQPVCARREDVCATERRDVRHWGRHHRTTTPLPLLSLPPSPPANLLQSPPPPQPTLPGLRFGLAQLHQLRGRVGRSDRQSSCFLLAPTGAKLAMERLQVSRMCWVGRGGG